MLIQFIHGFCMAMADSVPGISGGTIAFLLGFYDRFIGSMRDLVRGTRQERKEAILFLLKLGVGWVVGFALCVLVLTSFFEQHIYRVSSLFIGLTLFSIPLVVMEEKDVLRGKYQYLLFTAIGIGVVVLITSLRSGVGDGTAVDLSSLTVGLALYVFVSAMVAISAMILPGISGSSLLLIMGLYLPVMQALRSLLSLEFAYLPAIIIFGLGILAGVACSVGLIRQALKKKRAQTLYLILGLMLGSIYAIFIGPTTLEPAQAAMSFSTFRPLFFLLGAVLLLGLEFIKRKTTEKTDKGLA